MKIEFLENIKRIDPSATSYIEIILCYFGVWAIFFHRINHFLYKLKIPILPRFLSNIATSITNIEIHPEAQIGKNFFIDHGLGVVIGQTAKIGNNVTIYHGVTLGAKSNKKTRRHPTIGDNVIIGAGAKIIGDIKVEDNAKIGANTVIVKDVKKGEVIVTSNIKKIEKYDIEYFI